MSEPLRQVFHSRLRLAPDSPLPRSLFLPGTGDPRPSEAEYDDPDKAWRLGVDLYNHGYFWEAHEAWEFVWLQHPRESSEALFVRGCIQAAAALLKVRLRNFGGVTKLSTRSLETLGSAGEEQLFRIDIRKLREDLVKFWEPIKLNQFPKLEEFIRLSPEPA